MVHSEERLEGARRLIEQLYEPLDLYIIHADTQIDRKVVRRYREAMSVCGQIEFVSDEQSLRGEWAAWVRATLNAV